VQEARFVGLERLVRGPQCLRLQVLQPGYAFAIGLEHMATNGSPAQAAVETRARDVRVQELAHHREQVVERQQQRPAQGHGNGLLRRRQRRLQPVRGVAAVMNAVPIAPLPDGLLGDPVAPYTWPRPTRCLT